MGRNVRTGDTKRKGKVECGRCERGQPDRMMWGGAERKKKSCQERDNMTV